MSPLTPDQLRIIELEAIFKEMEANRVLIVGQNDELRAQVERLTQLLDDCRGYVTERERPLLHKAIKAALKSAQKGGSYELG